MDELKGLALTARVSVSERLYNSNDNINAAYYIGRGKLEELKMIIESSEINLVIFDHELTPAQFRNLEEVLAVKVIDRTQLILDIFALHAHTRESKLQVELAQLEYMLPRLKGKGADLSRLAGGIGTRGPGETKLEVDRRRIEKKIFRLKTQLEDVKRNRELQRKARKDPVISLVGYTNAGKSTLMNLLTGADTLVANKLFATLDTKLRSLTLTIGRTVILSDTVGFIEKLPHQLVASFYASLEEIRNSDILIHVIDSSQPESARRYRVVNKVLSDLGVMDKNIITVLNKIDLVSEIDKQELELLYPDSISISALTGKGRDLLLNKISEIIKKSMKTVVLELPYNHAHFIDKIHQEGQVFKEEYSKEKIRIEASINNTLAQKLGQFTQN